MLFEDFAMKRAPFTLYGQRVRYKSFACVTGVEADVALLCVVDDEYRRGLRDSFHSLPSVL